MKLSAWIGPLVVVIGLCHIAAVKWWVAVVPAALLATIVAHMLLRLMGER